MNKKRLVVVSIFIIIAILLLVLVIEVIDNKPLNGNNLIDKERNNYNRFEKYKEDFFNDDKKEIINISNKIRKVKKIEDIELTCFNTNITENILNKNDKDVDFDYINILDSYNNVFDTSNVYIGKVKSNISKRFEFYSDYKCC